MNPTPRRVAVLATILVGMGLVAVFIATERWNAAEIDFADRRHVASEIERGWLPSWFPPDLSSAQGAHLTFDENFTWVAGALPDAGGFIRTHCIARSPGEVALPPSVYLKRFPEHVRATRERLRRDPLVYFTCPDAQREFFAAIDESTSTFALWAY